VQQIRCNSETNGRVTDNRGANSPDGRILLKNAKIIGGFSGTGKSYVGVRYANTLDLDLGSYKYVYDEDPKIPFEARKAMKEYRINPNWPNNYIEAIEKNKPHYDLILVSYCPEIAGLLDYYFSPSPSGWAVLKKRFEERGNNPQFIKILHARFKQEINIPKSKFINVQLGRDEFLEQALIREGLL